MKPARADAPRQVTTLRLSPGERELAEQAAAINRQKYSDFARDAILTAASECLERPARRSGVLTPSGVLRS